jgi:hypothetical protein
MSAPSPPTAKSPTTAASPASASPASASRERPQHEYAPARPRAQLLTTPRAAPLAPPHRSRRRVGRLAQGGEGQGVRGIARASAGDAPAPRKLRALTAATREHPFLQYKREVAAKVGGGDVVGHAFDATSSVRP